MTAKVHEGIFWATGNIPYLDDETVTWVFTCIKSHQTALSKVYLLYLNYSSIKFLSKRLQSGNMNKNVFIKYV